jgi:hypothetical protein
LALYISRLLAPVWDMRPITPSSGNAAVWQAHLSHATMTVRAGRRCARPPACCCGARGLLHLGACKRGTTLEPLGWWQIQAHPDST